MVTPEAVVRLYPNGKPIGAGIIKISDLPRNGDVCIGHGNPAIVRTTSTDGIFIGRMDDLAIFHRVLSDQ